MQQGSTQTCPSLTLTLSRNSKKLQQSTRNSDILAHQNSDSKGTNKCRAIASGIISCLSFVKCLSFVNSKERAQGVAMARTNCVYRVLVMAFRRYESAIGSPGQPRESFSSHSSKTQAHLVLPSLLNEEHTVDKLRLQDGNVASHKTVLSSNSFKELESMCF